MDLIERQAAIDKFEPWLKVKGYSEGELNVLKAVLYELTIMPSASAQTKQSVCEYCHEDSDGYAKPLEKNGHAFIRFGMDGWELSLHAKGWHGSAKIKYCPICGRRLTHG